MKRRPLTETSVKRALQRSKWVVADAAKSLGVSKQGLYKFLKKSGMELQPQPDLGEKRRLAAYARWRSGVA